MLESLARKKPLTAPATRSRFRSPFRSASHRRTLEFSRSAAGTLFAAVKRIAKHSRHRSFPAQKMHLESVGLFVRARPGVDAANVWFRIRIRSSSHLRLPNGYLKQRRNQSVALFLSFKVAFSGGGRFQTCHFFSYSSAGNRT